MKLSYRSHYVMDNHYVMHNITSSTLAQQCSPCNIGWGFACVAMLNLFEVGTIDRFLIVERSPLDERHSDVSRGTAVEILAIFAAKHID